MEISIHIKIPKEVLYILVTILAVALIYIIAIINPHIVLIDAISGFLEILSSLLDIIYLLFPNNHTRQ